MDIARIPYTTNCNKQFVLARRLMVYTYGLRISPGYPILLAVPNQSCLTRDKELSDIVWRGIGIHHAVRVACVTVGAARHGGERAKVGPTLDVACLTEEGRRLLDKRLDLGLCADGASVEVHAGKLGSASG
jgi:hypothetical protein